MEKKGKENESFVNGYDLSKIPRRIKNAVGGTKMWQDAMYLQENNPRFRKQINETEKDVKKMET